MAISTKRKRKITVNQRRFLWYVAPDEDSADTILRVISEDKNFTVLYHLDQPESQRFLCIIGKEFPGRPQTASVWHRVLCPQWEQESVVAPNGVRHLIDWCLNRERELVFVDYKGQPIS